MDNILDNLCLMLGENHSEYGNVSSNQIDGIIACAMSIGSDKQSPSLMFKGDINSANEDALLAIRHDNLVVMAVADSHFGQWASHAIVTHLAEYSHTLSNPDSLHSVFQVLCEKYSDVTEHSETTLLVTCVDIVSGEGFGVSYGDSSAIVLSKTGSVLLNSKNHVYVSLNNLFSLSNDLANEFTFKLNQGEYLTLFTDGIDECHYGNPDTSISDEDIIQLYNAHRYDLNQFVSSLAILALAGVQGNPGGQDNLAIAAMTIK